VYIVDAQNKVIAHRDPSVVLRGTAYHVPDQDGIHPGLTGSSVVVAVDKIRLGDQQFNIVAEQAVVDALALAINTILITISLMAGALIISALLGLVIVRQIVHPIQAMATTAEAISAGDLSRQVQVTSRDEVGVLATAFNSMTTQLRQSLEKLEQEVVEVRQAEESLRRANATLQALIDYSPLAIIMLDLNSHILLWNIAAEKIYGWTAQEAVGKFIPFVSEDKLEELRTVFQRVNNGEVLTNLELQRRRKDGSEILISVSIAPLRDSAGKVYAQMSIATDITERKKAEQALRESEERLRQITSSLREVIWLRDNQTRQVLYVNPAFELLTGQTCENFYENPDIMFNAIHPDDREEVKEALDQRIKGVPYEKEHRVVHLDGSTRWVSSRSFPVRNDAGEIYRWVSTMEDITLRKQAEEEILRLNTELEQRVVERTAQLQAANKELEAFSYSVSHDLRAPLRSINGFSHAILEDYAECLDDEGKGYLQNVLSGSLRMERLIDDMLRLSRITRSELYYTTVDLSALARDIAAELQKRDPERRAEFIIPPELTVNADLNLMRIALENLLGNAWKFTGKNPTARIELGMVQHEGKPAYFVRDDGAGFDMAYAGKLFGAFQRLHGMNEFEGTGVGLAIVQRVVHRHGGQVWAEAETGKGATFFFTLK
jgi:PAS domain S-box-containing protein